MDTEGLMKSLASYLAPISDNVPGFLCRNQSIAYVNAFGERTSWAMKMWDSSAKIQAGLLTGNMHSLGNFDECLSVRDVESASGNFSGQHCLATISLVNTTALDVMGKLMKDVLEEEKEINIGLGALLSKGLRWGYCIPSTCSSTDVSTGLSDHLRNITGVAVTVNDSDCSVYGERPFTLPDWIAISLILFLLFIIVLSTGYEAVKDFFRELDEKKGEEGRWNKLNRRTRRTQSPDAPVEGHVNENPPAQRPDSLDLAGPKLRPRSVLRNVIRKRNLQAIQETDEQEQDQEPEPAPGQSAEIEDSAEDGNNLVPELESPVRFPKDYECDILTSFSLISNARQIFTFNDSKLLLTSVDGIKFLSLCWIVLAHACYITGTLPALNYISVFEYVSRWPSVLILNTQLAVDTFLVCTGVLISYNFFNDMNRRGIQQLPASGRVTSAMNKKFLLWYLPVYYFHRYIRLAPALALMVLLQASLLSHVGSGPFWAAGSGYLSEMCHESWWGTLLFVQNYIEGDRICLPHSWYVMVDLQLYLISPIILMMFLYFRQWKALYTAGVIAFLGTSCTLFTNYYFKLPAAMLKGGYKKWLLKTKYEYVTAYTRLAPWIIGMTVGFLLYHRRRREREDPSIKTVVVIFGWIAAITCMAYATFGMVPYLHDTDSDIVWRSLFSGTFHTVWALGVGWVIFACETHHGGIIHLALSQKVFQPLRQLTYCTFLVHLPLMTHRAFFTRVPIHVNKATGISSFFGDLLFSFMFACMLSLLVELPFARLFKTISLRYGFAFRKTPEEFLMRRLSGYDHLADSILRARQDFHARVLGYQVIAGSEQDNPDGQDAQRPLDQEIPPRYQVAPDPQPPQDQENPQPGPSNAPSVAVKLSEIASDSGEPDVSVQPGTAAMSDSDSPGEASGGQMVVTAVIETSGTTRAQT